MKHLLNCIESVKYESVQDAILLHNLKRKIVEEPTEIIEDVKRQYNVHYSPTKVRTLSIRNDSKGICLYDDDSQQARFIYPSSGNMKPMLIPPIGCKRIVPYNYSKVRLSTLPHLHRDAMRCIFKHLPGWELLSMRLVCKKWNSILVSTNNLWDIRICRSPDRWIGLSPFHTYLQHMFLNITDMSAVYAFFLKNSKFFIYIVGLLQGHFDLGPSKITKDEICVKGYTLHRKTGLTYNDRWMNFEVFLDAYRQSLL